MIFSLNKEIQAPSIYLIDNHIFFTSTPRKFHTLLSLYYVQPCKNQKKTQFTFPSSETTQESSSNEPSFDVHRIPSKTFLLLQKKKEKTSPRTLDYPCCIRGICRFSLNRLQRYPCNEKKKKKDVSSPLTVKDQSFTSLEHGPPFSPPRCERPRVRSSSKLIRPPSPLCSLL